MGASSTFIRRPLRFATIEELLGDIRIPRVQEGTDGTERLPTEVGAERLRRALQRLRTGDPARHDSPAFGPMSHEDRIQLNLRHAELHLSFLDYAS